MAGTTREAAPALARPVWLLRQFLQRELANRFAGSLLGGLWAFLHPIALLVVYGFVFSAVFRVKLPAGDGTPFLLFVAVALWPWQAFSEGLLRGMGAVTGNAALVKKVPFRHDLLVYASVTASFGLHLLGYVLVLGLLALWGFALHWEALPRVMLSLAGLYLLATGLALVTSALHVFVRDLEQALAHGLALLFYLSPVLYSASMVPEWLRGVMALNPIAILIEPIRAGLLQGQLVPSVGELVAVAACAAFALLGRWLFLRLSPHFEDAL